MLTKLKKSWRPALSVLLAAALITACGSDDTSSATDADSPDIELSGQLTDVNTGDPIANADLTIDGSLAKAGAERATTTTKTDANGFYTFVIKGVGQTITIQITAEDGTDLGSIGITIASNLTVDNVDTSNAPSVKAPIPTLVEKKDTEEPVIPDLSGTYAESEFQLYDRTAKQSKVMPVGPIVIDSNKRIVFGVARGGAFSADGRKLSMTVGSDVSLVLDCSYSGSGVGLTSTCVTQNLAVPGDNNTVQYLDVKLISVKTSLNSTVADATANLYAASGTMNLDGSTNVDWGSATAFVTDAPDDSDTSLGLSGGELTNVYLGWDAGFGRLWVLLEGPSINADTNYRVTLRNSDYSEIMFEVYSGDGGSNWDFNYRINDGNNNGFSITSGVEGTDYGHFVGGSAIEFYATLGQLKADDGSLVDPGLLNTMEFEVQARADGDRIADMIYPVSTIDLQLLP